MSDVSEAVEAAEKVVIPADGVEHNSDAKENEAGEAAAADEGEIDDGEEDLVLLGDEQPPEQSSEDREPAPAWVRDLRKINRELTKENQRLKASQAKPVSEEVRPLPKKPALSDDDIAYDDAKYEAELLKWHADKRAHDEVQQRKQAENERAQKEWVERLQSYESSKKTLKVRDFEEAEENILNSLNTVQQGIIVQGSDNPALMVYALGKRPKELERLKGITDPVKFAFAVAKMEAQVKVQKSNAKPGTAPETPVRGGRSASPESQRERLLDEATRTGDMTKYRAFMNAQREAARSG
jgi:hypothetical protein